MSEPTVAARVIEILASEGVRMVSGYPTTPLLEYAAVAGLRPIVCRQERVGVNIADGYARTSGGEPFGVFVMQAGPGAENAYSGVATAYADSVPLLVIPMGYPADRENVDRYFSSLRNYGAVSKSAQRIRFPGETDAVMRRAISALRMGRPGPVVVELPMDVAAAPSTSPEPWTPVVSARPAPDPVMVGRAVEMLTAAANPVVVAGQGVLYAGATPMLVRLAEAMHLPVATTLAGKSAFPEDHPLALGCGAMTMPEAVHGHLRQADVVLAVGASMMRHTMTATVPAQKELIHISVDPSDFNRDHPASIPIQADARLALEAMLTTWGGGKNTNRPDPAPSIRETHSQWRERWERHLTSEAVPVGPYRVVHEICAGFPPESSIVTHDSGSPRDQLVPFYPAGRPHSYIGWGKSHALGTGLGLAIGAKLADPGKYCVALMGDAAFGMTGLDLETAVRNEISVIVIVNNNQTMAIETDLMRWSHERYGTRDIGGDYSALARSLGADARRVENPEDLADALEWSKSRNDAGRPALVEVLTSAELADFSHRGALR